MHVIQRERSDNPRLGRNPPNPAVIQSLRQQAKNPPNGSSMLTTRIPQTLLSFSRSARESPHWFRRGSDNVLPRPSAGDPRFARMTEEGMPLPRPRFGALPCVGDSTGYWRTPLNDGDLGSPRPRPRTRPAPHSPLRTSFRGSGATEESPGWFVWGATIAACQVLLSFSRSARESPRWFCRGSDDVLLCPCVGDSTGFAL